jgi:hypothetical protein
MVSELIGQHTKWWNFSLIQELFTEEEVEKICGLAISLDSQADQLIWKENKNGSFSVRSAYFLAKLLADRGRGSVSQPMNSMWRTVWKVRGPPVVKLFLWKACRDILAAKENLFRRKIVPDPLCLICGLETETMGHILWSCGSAKDVWLESTRKLQKSTSDEVDFFHLFAAMAEKLDPGELQMFSVIARELWLRRNNLVFGGALTAPSVVIKNAKEKVEAYEEAEAWRSKGTLRECTPTSHPAWTKPPEGFLKVNWDASVNGQRKRMGLGVAVRDHEGVLRAALCATRDFITEPAVAEAVAAGKAVEVITWLGAEKVILEGDALEIVNVFSNEERWMGTYGGIMHEAKQILNFYCTEWRVKHVQRCCNEVAHAIARMALHVNQECLRIDNFPSYIGDLVNAEQGSV